MTIAAPLFDRALARPATRPPEARGVPRDGVRLLVTGPDGHRHAVFRDLPELLEPGTLLVVNRSATLAASLPATGPVGEFILNLSTRYGTRLWLAEPRWSASEPGPLPLESGTTIRVAGVRARLIRSYPGLDRLWFVRFEDDPARVLVAGSPIRYRYVEPAYPPLAAYQTIFATVPGSAEMPSAARPFTRRTLDALRKRDIAIVPIVLHTGVSSLDATDAGGIERPILPPEPFEVPCTTAAAVNRARSDGRPVIAVGTTVVRALESARTRGRLRAARGFTRRFVHPGRPPDSIDGLLTGLHEPDATHLAMLRALAGEDLVTEAYGEAIREGYLWHEFGDSHLLLRT